LIKRVLKIIMIRLKMRHYNLNWKKMKH